MCIKQSLSIWHICMELIDFGRAFDSMLHLWIMARSNIVPVYRMQSPGLVACSIQDSARDSLLWQTNTQRMEFITSPFSLTNFRKKWKFWSYTFELSMTLMEKINTIMPSTVLWKEHQIQLWVLMEQRLAHRTEDREVPGSSPTQN